MDQKLPYPKHHRLDHYIPSHNRNDRGRILSWSYAPDHNTTKRSQMNLSIQEVDHILKALETMRSNHDVARAREQIEAGVTNHEGLIQRLKDYKLGLTSPAYDAWSFE